MEVGKQKVMEIIDIIYECGMSSRPEYYSGRGAITCDLNSKQLFKFHSLIKAHHGEKAATAFVDMVEDMPNMNATDFLNNCYRLAYGGWKWEKKSAKKNGHDIPKDKNGNYDIEMGKLSIMSAIMNKGRDQTDRIRGQFLRANGRDSAMRNIVFESPNGEIIYRDENGIIRRKWY